MGKGIRQSARAAICRSVEPFLLRIFSLFALSEKTRIPDRQFRLPAGDAYFCAVFRAEQRPPDSIRRGGAYPGRRSNGPAFLLRQISFCCSALVSGPRDFSAVRIFFDRQVKFFRTGAL